MKIGITTIQRDRAKWIKEWIIFHYLVGFRSFYFYAHECKDNSVEILNHLKKHFDIYVFTPALEKDENLVVKCYQHSYDHFGNDVDWMAYIDGDEFLFPTNAKTIETPLSEYNDKDISSLAVYWSCFGSSGHIKEPDGLIIENFTKKAPTDYQNNKHIKSILKGHQGKLVRAKFSHIFDTPKGTFDEKLRKVDSGWTNYDPSYEKFCINHYVTQSRSFYLNWKRHSKSLETGGRDGIDRDEDWWKEHDRNDIKDNSLEKYVEPLKNILNKI